jgi:hypothetical protein
VGPLANFGAKFFLNFSLVIMLASVAVGGCNDVAGCSRCVAQMFPGVPGKWVLRVEFLDPIQNCNMCPPDFRELSNSGPTQPVKS